MRELLVNNDQKPSSTSHRESVAQEKAVARIELNKLSFRYSRNDNWVFDDVNLEIQKGQFIGVVGESGSGKSTFVDLLLGLIKPVLSALIANLRKCSYQTQILLLLQ